MKNMKGFGAKATPYTKAAPTDKGAAMPARNMGGGGGGKGFMAMGKKPSPTKAQAMSKRGK